MSKQAKQDFAAQVPGAVVQPTPKAAKRPAPKATKGGKPSVRGIVVPATYAPGATSLAKVRAGTWGRYMVAITLKATTPAAAVKLHKAKARRAGFNPAKPLDFKWMLAKGFIAHA